MSVFAATTSVPVERSRAEIEATLKRYGCAEFAYYEQPNGAAIMFKLRGHAFRLEVPFPPAPASDARGQARLQDRRAQEIRQRWRVLLLLLKAKLESCECGLTRFEDEFLGSMLLPGNRTVAQALEGQLDQVLAGKVPLMLPGLGETSR